MITSITLELLTAAYYGIYVLDSCSVGASVSMIHCASACRAYGTCGGIVWDTTAVSVPLLWGLTWRVEIYCDIYIYTV